MASGSFNIYSSDSKLAGKIDWSSTSNGSSANTSNLTVALYVRRTDGYTTKGTWTGEIDFGGETFNFSNASTSVGSNWVLMISKTKTVSHNNDGTKQEWIHGECYAPSGTSLAGQYVGGAETVTLDTIPRYASISHSLNSTGLNSARINWSSDSTCDYLQYSINGGAWVGASGNPYTISGLSPNTTYKVKTRVRRKDSQLYSQTGDLSITTKDIGRIASVGNFEHGNSTSISITNPSGATLNLVMKIGNTQIFSRTVTTATKTITFSDAELDAIYKLYGSGSSLTATFILTTAGAYTNSKTATITLKGNQKTVKENISGTYRRAKTWINVNGTWRRAVIWVNINGTWKRGI